MKILIFGDPPNKAITLNFQSSQFISDIQRIIFQNYCSTQIQSHFQPENLIIYKVLEPLSTDDNRLTPESIAIGYLIHDGNIVERMFNVRQCQPNENYSSIHDADSNGTNIKLIVYIAGYYELFHQLPSHAHAFISDYAHPFFSQPSSASPSIYNVSSTLRSTSTAGQSSGISNPLNYVIPANTEYICQWTPPSQPVCGFLCDNGKSLLSHIDQRHIGYSKTNDLCLKCCWPGCTYEADKKRHHIVSHLKVHVRDADFECEVCGKCYKRANELNVHKKIHQGSVFTRVFSKSRGSISNKDVSRTSIDNRSIASRRAKLSLEPNLIDDNETPDAMIPPLSTNNIPHSMETTGIHSLTLNRTTTRSESISIQIEDISNISNANLQAGDSLLKENDPINLYFNLSQFEADVQVPNTSSNTATSEPKARPSLSNKASLSRHRSSADIPIATSSDSPPVRLKLVIAGDTGSGKTSLIRRIHKDEYNASDLPDIWNICVVEKLKHKKNVELEMWDTLCEEKYNQHRFLSYNESDVVILAFSTIFPQSLENILEKWVGEVQHFCHSVPIFLVGCKADLRENILDPNMIVSKEKGKEFAQRIGASAYFEVSAKTGDGIEDLLSGLENVEKRFVRHVNYRKSAKKKCAIL